MLQQFVRLIGVQHRGLAGFHHMLGATDGMRRIGRDDLAGNQPVEQHADGSQVLLDRWFLEVLAERLDIGSDVQRLDIGELADLVMVAPGEEPADRMQIRRPGVPVAGGGGEEFQEALRRRVAGIGDDHRHDDRGCDRAGDPPGLGGRDDGQLTAGFRVGVRHGFSVTFWESVSFSKAGCSDVPKSAAALARGREIELAE
jgi:hypothetical protein